MGLDSYARYIKPDGEVEEIKYWRRCYHIQNWMQKLYAKKVGVANAGDFNGVAVSITEEDIMQFVQDVRNKKMLDDNSYFCCSYDPANEETMEDDLDFAAQCLKHLWMNREVYYTSSW